MPTDNQDNRTATILKVLLGGVVLSFLSFVSSVSTIVTSSWFKALISSNAFRWVPYILNILLSIFVVYLYRKTNRAYAVLSSSLTTVQKALADEGTVHNRLWKRYVRTLRAMVLDTISTPTLRDSLEPLLDELTKKLPESGIDFKIGLAKPFLDGSFKFLAERGMDPASVHKMERKANWKENQSFFSNGLYLSDEKPYRKYKSGDQNYSNIQRDQGVGTSVSHFVVAIKDPVYPEGLFPENTLAVLSIGIPKRYDLQNEQEEASFYETIFPFVKSIESMLLDQLTADKKAEAKKQ